MTHFIDEYADRFIVFLHAHLPARFFRQEIIEVPGLISGVLVTFDGVLDDVRETHTMTFDQFVARMIRVKPDWQTKKNLLPPLREAPEKTIKGWEGRTIYVIRGGQNPEQWTQASATSDALMLLGRDTQAAAANIIYEQVNQLRAVIPVGHRHFSHYENFVRICFNYLFCSTGELEEGQPQSRTASENEGVEKRDVIFQNRATSGFWHGLKTKYLASEIVVDAKNTDDLGRDDLRQLYCYLKPALGFWGFIVCRTAPSDLIGSFNRTLFKNFEQERGLLILCDDDLRRMVEMARRGENPSDYLQRLMSEFVRSI
jgi:hypothetical protein